MSSFVLYLDRMIQLSCPFYPEPQWYEPYVCPYEKKKLHRLIIEEPVVTTLSDSFAHSHLSQDLGNIYHYYPDTDTSLSGVIVRLSEMIPFKVSRQPYMQSCYSSSQVPGQSP